MNREFKQTPFDQRLFLIFIVTFATMTAFEFIGQFLFPYIPDWRSNLITSLFASGLAVVLAYFLLSSYYAENARVLSEIKRRSLVETDLREGEEKFRSIVETSPDVIWEVDLQGKFRYISPRVTTLLGYTPEEVIGRSITDMVTGQGKSFIMQELARHIVSDGVFSPIEVPIRHRNGNELVIEIRPARLTGTDGTLKGFRGVAVDITERKKAEKALRESEEQFRTILNSLQAGVVIIDSSTHRILDVNPKALEMIGEVKESVVGPICHNFICPAEAGKCPVMDLGQTVDSSERVLITPTGEKKPILKSVIKMMLGGREVLVESFFDLTERKKTEEALRESEEKFRMVVENTLDGILIITFSGVVLFRNRALANIFDCVGDSYLFNTKNVIEFTYPESRSQVLHDLSQISQGIDSYPVNYSVKTATGRQIWIESIGKRIHFQNSHAILLSIKDITSRKRMEEAIIRSNKHLNLLSSITRHDINNQLQALNVSAELLHMKIPDPSFENDFAHILEASNRITSMIRFTKEYDEIGSHAAIWQNLQALVNSAGKNVALGPVTLKLDLPANIEVFADPLIVKVFFNLIDNALRHGGRITTIRFSIGTRNGARIIVCEDDGDGVVNEDKERIFVRGFGKNTGFGLAISREILDITGITIIETGVAGKGACFEMVVPKEAYRIAGMQATSR